LPLITVCVALLIRAELRFDKRQIYVLKPLATLLVIALALTAGVDGTSTARTQPLSQLDPAGAGTVPGW
jgi:hypothetical protein